MEIRFEMPKIESYSKVLAERLCNDFFSRNEAINGEQIVSLTPIEQVNMFVLKNLFDKWRDESGKLKSPYFNYENSTVKEALKKVLNALSQNIYIRKEFFKPLLEKGISDTLCLLLNPQGYFHAEFSSKAVVRLSEIKESEKFFKINKTIVQQLIEKLERENKPESRGSELSAWTDAFIKENLSLLQEKSSYLEQFSSLLKLEWNSAQPVVPVMEEKNVVGEVKQQVISANTILNEKFGGGQTTVNDLLKEPKTTLAEKISKSKIEKIKGAISLSQKFLFISALFKGENTEYEKALSEIDECLNYHDALKLINESYASKYQWDYDQQEVKEFVQVVERKFS